MKIGVGYRVWFYHKDKEYSGYVQRINGDKTLKVSVYYIDGVALGRYEILDRIDLDLITKALKGHK